MHQFDVILQDLDGLLVRPRHGINNDAAVFYYLRN